MANHISIPFKRTSILNVRQATRDYLQSHREDTHPNAWKDDVTRWESFRTAALLDERTHVDRVEALLKCVLRIGVRRPALI
jgi:programmed cell death 6-interacting protein